MPHLSAWTAPAVAAVTVAEWNSCHEMVYRASYSTVNRLNFRYIQAHCLTHWRVGMYRFFVCPVVVGSVSSQDSVAWTDGREGCGTCCMHCQSFSLDWVGKGSSEVSLYLLLSSVTSSFYIVLHMCNTLVFDEKCTRFNTLYFVNALYVFPGWI